MPLVDCNGNPVHNVDQNTGAMIDWSKINPMGLISEEANQKIVNDAMLLEKRMMV